MGLAVEILGLVIFLGAHSFVTMRDRRAALIAKIEAAQTSDRQELDGLTLAEPMHRFHVPGLSIAVIRDFKIHWAKAYGIADAESGRAEDRHDRHE